MSKQTDTATSYGEEDSDHGLYRNKLANMLTTSTLGRPHSTRTGLTKHTDEGIADSEESDGLYRDHPLDTTTTVGERTSTDMGSATTHVDVHPEHSKDSTFPKQTPKSQATNKKGGYLTGVLLILLLCAIGGGVYFFLKFRERQSEISFLKESFDDQKGKFESEISRLKTELEEAKKQSPTAADASLESEISRLKAELEEAKKQHITQLESLTKQAQEKSQSELKAKDKELETARKETQSLSAKIENLESAHEESQKEQEIAKLQAAEREQNEVAAKEKEQFMQRVTQEQASAFEKRKSEHEQEIKDRVIREFENKKEALESQTKDLQEKQTQIGKYIKDPEHIRTGLRRSYVDFLKAVDPKLFQEKQTIARANPKRAQWILE